jgi:2-polyprenyl-3-methyl-5-hydroxy-6-metoxy-1,4-benzoquinol methylase
MFRILKQKEAATYYEKYYPKLMKLWESAQYYDPRSELLIKLGTGRWKNKKILDVGCGTGKVLKDAKIIENNRVYGIDISRPFLEKARRKGIITMRFDINKKDRFPYPEKSFDCIVLLDVLEHIYYPRRLIKNCSAALKRGGTLILTLSKRIGGEFSVNKAKSMEMQLKKVYAGNVPDEARRFVDFNFMTTKELKRILSAEGLRIVRMHGYNWKWNTLSSAEKQKLWKNPMRSKNVLYVIKKS